MIWLTGAIAAGIVLAAIVASRRRKKSGGTQGENTPSSVLPFHPDPWVRHGIREEQRLVEEAQGVRYFPDDDRHHRFTGIVEDGVNKG